MIYVAVAGCAGQMGSRIVVALEECSEALLGAGFERPGHPALGQDVGLVAGIGAKGVFVADSVTVASACRILIDFTSPDATLTHAAYCADKGIALVVGTTGLSVPQKEQLMKYSEKTALVVAPNMGIGINVLISIIRKVSEALGASYDIEVIEAHHRRKKDAPSGTALALAEAAAAGRGHVLQDKAVYGRQGGDSLRKDDEIGIHAIRGGDIIGDHTVLFAGSGETVEIRHSVITRDVLAKGAVRAALFLANKSKGLFSMQDVLGL